MPEIKKGTTRDMTSGNIVMQILMFSLPLMMGNIFQMLYNTVDSIVVGNFVGKEALAAVGSTTMIVNMLVFFFNGFSIGACVIIGQYFGARDMDKLHRSVETTMAMTFIFCAVMTAIGVLGVDWVGNKQDTTRLSFLSDVRIMSVGARNSEDADDYYKPFQFYIASGSYPLTRGLYITSTDPRTRSMQRNFFFYLTDNPNHNNMGQMMILRFSQLLPYMAVQSHNVVIKRY